MSNLEAKGMRGIDFILIVDRYPQNTPIACSNKSSGIFIMVVPSIMMLVATEWQTIGISCFRSPGDLEI